MTEHKDWQDELFRNNFEKKQMFLIFKGDYESFENSKFQVFLYDDAVNTFEHVVNVLMNVFGHNLAIASRLAVEAHSKGRTVAEVEGKKEAIHHQYQLLASGLISGVAVI